MVQLRSKGIPAKSNLLQISSEVKMEPEDDIALNYLASQFPSDYKIEEVKKVIKPPTEAQTNAQEKTEMIAYASKVTEEADDFQKQIEEKAKDKKEETHFDDLDEEAMVQIDQKHPNSEMIKPLNLAQTSSKEDQLENNELL